MKKLFLLSLVLLAGQAYSYPKDSPSSGFNSAAVGAFGTAEYKEESVDLGTRFVEVKLTSAQIRTLNTSPVLVVTSPGEGKVLLPVAAYGFLDYGSATYVSPSDANLDVEFGATGSGNVAISMTETLMEGTADTAMYTPAVEVIPTANAALFAHMSTGNPTIGDGNIWLRVYYKVAPHPLSLAQ